MTKTPEEFAAWLARPEQRETARRRIWQEYQEQEEEESDEQRRE